MGCFVGLYKSFYQRFYFPFYEGLIKKRKTSLYIKQLEKSQWKSNEDLKSQQLIGLNALLQYAALHSKYFMECLKGVCLPLTSIEEIGLLPIMNKNIIRSNFDSIICEPYRSKLWKKSTGGSTGQPLHFGYTKESYEWRMALSRRGYAWGRAELGSKQAYIWGSQLGEVSKLKKVKSHIHHFIDRHKYYNCFNFGSMEMEETLSDLNRWQPDALVGYTNPLYEFALYVESVGGPRFNPQSILCAAEKVYPFQRELLQRVFNCPVYNTYGSREFMLIASECEKHEGLHVSMENLVVEVVDDYGMQVGPGEIGRVLVTDLHNYGMPFIRYEIGDLARVSERDCSCGRGLMLLDDVVGRSLDIIRTPGGKVVPGEFFPHLFKEYPQVSRFQVIQKKIDMITIKYVLSDPLPDEARKQFVAEVRKVVGPEMIINFDLVDKINLTSSGKYRITISDMD